jgi:hypothetical protein
VKRSWAEGVLGNRRCKAPPKRNDRTIGMYPQPTGFVASRATAHTELPALVLPQLACLNLDYAY